MIYKHLNGAHCITCFLKKMLSKHVFFPILIINNLHKISKVHAAVHKLRRSCQQEQRGVSTAAKN